MKTSEDKKILKLLRACVETNDLSFDEVLENINKVIKIVESK